MEISITDLYDTPSKKLDRETAKSLTDFVRISIDDKFQSAKDELVTKYFLRAELSEFV